MYYIWMQCIHPRSLTSIICFAEGVPTPMLSWQKDGVALSDGQGCRINTNGGHTQLIVEAADGSSSGWYQCTAVNVGGTAATRGKVLIDGGETSAAAVQRYI